MQTSLVNVSLNRDIESNELHKAIESLKVNKATGVDDLSNEVLKSPKLFDILFNLLRRCFDNSMVPSTWFKPVIIPIPKSPKDERVSQR